MATPSVLGFTHENPAWLLQMLRAMCTGTLSAVAKTTGRCILGLAADADIGLVRF